VAAADWLQQLCFMNFYVHVAKYANELKTVLQLFLATLKLFYFSCSHGFSGPGADTSAAHGIALVTSRSRLNHRAV